MDRVDQLRSSVSCRRLDHFQISRMKKTITIDFKAVAFWAMAIAFVIMFFRSCGGNFLGGLFGKKRADTISIRRDTVWAVVQGDTVYKPMPYSVTNTVYKTIYRTDTLESFEVRIDPADTAAILARHFEKVFYSDTLNRRDTGLNKYGKVIVNDTIHGNRITSRRLVTDLRIPEVTNTITLNQKRNVVYFDVNVLSSQNTPLVAIGGGLSLKSKNDKIYSAGAMTTKDGTMYYTAGMKIPIRLNFFKSQKP